MFIITGLIKLVSGAVKGAQTRRAERLEEKSEEQVRTKRVLAEAFEYRRQQWIDAANTAVHQIQTQTEAERAKLRQQTALFLLAGGVMVGLVAILAVRRRRAA